MTFAGLPKSMEPGGRMGLSGNYSPGPYQAAFFQHSSVQDNGPHADETAIPDGTAMNNGPMADGAMLSHHRGVMEDCVILDVGPFAYRNGTVISPQDGTVPDIDIFSQHHISHDRSVGRDIHLIFHDSPPLWIV